MPQILAFQCSQLLESFLPPTVGSKINRDTYIFYSDCPRCFLPATPTNTNYPISRRSQGRSRSDRVSYQMDRYSTNKKRNSNTPGWRFDDRRHRYGSDSIGALENGLISRKKTHFCDGGSRIVLQGDSYFRLYALFEILTARRRTRVNIVNVLGTGVLRKTASSVGGTRRRRTRRFL